MKAPWEGGMGREQSRELSGERGDKRAGHLPPMAGAENRHLFVTFSKGARSS